MERWPYIHKAGGGGGDICRTEKRCLISTSSRPEQKQTNVKIELVFFTNSTNLLQKKQKQTSTLVRTRLKDPEDKYAVLNRVCKCFI